VAAAVLAASILPLSTTYSVCEALGFESGLDDPFREARVFYLGYGAVVVVAAGVVLVPAIPLVPVLYLTQVLNAVLLLPIMAFLWLMGRDPGVMGPHTSGRTATVAQAAAVLLVGGCVVALLVAGLG